MKSISKEFMIEMAHRLPFHTGKCAHIHGHSWKIEIEVTGEEHTSGSAQNMILDYADLKQCMLPIDMIFDHSLLLCKDDHLAMMFRDITTPHLSKQLRHFPELAQLESPYGKINLIQGQPTSENFVDIVRLLMFEALPAGIKLVSVKVHETCTSTATWTNDEL